jgi:hypothetical protein
MSNDDSDKNNIKNQSYHLEVMIIIKFLFICVPTQQPKGQLQCENDNDNNNNNNNIFTVASNKILNGLGFNRMTLYSLSRRDSPRVKLNFIV